MRCVFGGIIASQNSRRKKRSIENSDETDTRDDNATLSINQSTRMPGTENKMQWHPEFALFKKSVLIGYSSVFIFQRTLV